MSKKLKEVKKQVAVLELDGDKISIKEYDTVFYNEETNKYKVSHNNYGVYCSADQDYWVGKYCMVINLEALPDACVAVVKSELLKKHKDKKVFEGCVSKCRDKIVVLDGMLNNLLNSL